MFLRRSLIGILTSVGLLTTATMRGQDGSQKWAYSTLSSSVQGNILSSPAVGPDGTVYVGVEVGSSSSIVSAGRLFAIKPDGSLRWVFNTADWVDSAPTVARDGTVYFGCWDGKLYALNSSGGQLWTYSTGSFILGSPALATDGTLYVGAGNGNLYAINSNGTLKWIFPTEDWIEGSPAVGPDGTIYVGSWDKRLYAIRPDGVEKWRYTSPGQIASSPAIAANGTVYVGGRDNVVYALNADGSLKWQFDAGDIVDASPVIGSDGAIYFGSLGGRFFAVNPDGTERWRYPRAGQTAIKSISSTAAVRADGSIVFGSSDAAVFALKSDGTLLWKTTLGDWVDSSPVVAPDGMIYVGCTDKKLYALNGSSPSTLSDWPQFRRDPAHNAQQVIGRITGTTGRLSNLSTRAQAGTGSETLITGFVTAGTGQRNLLVRGIGPSLAQFSLTGLLANPQLKAYSGNNVIANNDDWSQATNATQIVTTSSAVGAFPLTQGSLDAVLLQSFNPGDYTVHVTGANGGTGLALMEVYDAGGTGNTRLINLSARSTVGTGSNIMIAGFVVTGSTRAVMIRGIGPTLANFQVGGPLADPQLKLYWGQQLVAENDNWSSTSDINVVNTATSAAGTWDLPANSKDAVLVVTLAPGDYTALISGVNSTTGVALVEVYELP